MKAFLFAMLLGSVSQASVPLVHGLKDSAGDKILVDNFGRTLYVFDVDQAAGKVQCVGDCAEVWPAYLLTDQDIKEQIAGSNDLGTAVRPNGQKQLTFRGRPVYTYAFDRDLGETKGDGLGGVWHVIKEK